MFKIAGCGWHLLLWIQELNYVMQCHLVSGTALAFELISRNALASGFPREEKQPGANARRLMSDDITGG